MPIGRLVTDLAPAVAAAALVIVVGLPLADLMRTIDAGAVPTVLVAGVAGLCVQAISLRAFFPEVWDDISRILRRLVPSRAAKSSAASAALTQ